MEEKVCVECNPRFDRSLQGWAGPLRQAISRLSQQHPGEPTDTRSIGTEYSGVNDDFKVN